MTCSSLRHRGVKATQQDQDFIALLAQDVSHPLIHEIKTKEEEEHIRTRTSPQIFAWKVSLLFVSKRDSSTDDDSPG